jgi:hypothetical protein
MLSDAIQAQRLQNSSSVTDMALLLSLPRFLSHELYFSLTFDLSSEFKNITKKVLHLQMKHAKPKVFVG